MMNKTKKPLQIKYCSVKSLIPYTNNARVHSDEQVSQIMSSINEFGFTNPILINNKKEIIAGHGRLMAAFRLDLDQVPTIELSQLTKTQQRAYILADNKLALNASWDDDLLNIELSDLKDLDFDLSLIGFGIDELDEIMLPMLDEGLTDPDDVPAVEEIPISETGDIWTLGEHRVMCVDSTLKDDIEKLMNGEKADTVFTDPPYGMSLNADWSSAKSPLKFAKEKNALGGNKYKNVIGDHDDFDSKLIQTIFDNFGYCKEIFLWGADYYSEYLQNKNTGSWVVWDKRLDESADKMYGSTFELCWSKAKHKRMLARIKWAGIFGTEKEFDRKRHHPTQKPIALVEWFFEYYSLLNKKNVVDLYGGSGSTVIASEKHNINCYMMEIDPHYIDVIVRRWQAFTGKVATTQHGKTITIADEANS